MAPIPVLGRVASALLGLALASRFLLTWWVVYAWAVLLPVLWAVRSTCHWIKAASTNTALLTAMLWPPFGSSKPSFSTSTTAPRTRGARAKLTKRRRQRQPSLSSSTTVADGLPLSLPLSPLESPPPPLLPLPPSQQPTTARQRKRSSNSTIKRAPTASTVTTQTLRPHALFHHQQIHPIDDSITTSASITATLPHIPPLSIRRPPSSLFSSFSTTASSSSSSSSSFLPGNNNSSSLAAIWPYPECFFFLANNLRVHYIDVSPPPPATSTSAANAKPLKTLVLLHGVLGWSASAYAKHIPMYLDLGYRVVALDLPGHGKSDKPPRHAHTFGLYVTAMIELFAHVLGDPLSASSAPAPAPAPAGPVAVVAQGVAATFFALACAASPLVATSVTHLILMSPYAPPRPRDALLHVLAARACTRVLDALPHGLAPCLETVARGMMAGAAPQGGGVWDVPGTSLLVPLTVLGKFPVPYLANVPTERVLALFDVSPASASSPTSMDMLGRRGGSGGGAGSASPGQASFDSGVAGLAAPPLRTGEHTHGCESVSSRMSSTLVSLISTLAKIADRATALDLAAAQMHLREWAHSPPPPPPPPPLLPAAGAGPASPSAPWSPARPLPPPRRQVLVLYGAQDTLVGCGARAAAAWAKVCDAQRVVGVPRAGALMGAEGAVACVDSICEFLDAPV